MTKSTDKENNKNKEKNKVKGYGILFVIFALCIGLTLYLCKWYNVYDEYQKETPVIRGVLSEVDYEEFEHYVLDNPSTIIYMCTSQDDSCRKFENDFKKLINKNAYADELIYLNLSGLDKEEFVNKFNDKFNFKTKLTSNYPALVVFRDGEVEAILQGRENESLSISKVKSFIEIYKIGE